MKKYSFIKAGIGIFAILAMGLFSGCKDKAKNVSPLGEESYYWAGEKINVWKYYGIVTVRHTAGLTNTGIAALLGVKSSDLELVSRVHERLWRITFKNKIPSGLSDQFMPTLRTHYTKDVSMLTGEISIKPRGDTNLGAIATKYGLTVVETLNYGAVLFATPIPAKTLEIANRIHEEENIEWAAPNMISLISLH